MSFVNDVRYQQEQRMRPAVDEIYKSAFGDVLASIDREDGSVLDREHGIDVTLGFTNGMVLTGQEKTLSADFAHHASLTVEYAQVHKVGEPGDWYSLAAQFYFVGYCKADGPGFSSWAIVNWPALVLETQRGNIRWRDNHNKDGRARASFRYVKLSHIPRSCIITGRL